MADSDDELAQRMGMSLEDARRWRYSDRYPGFKGTAEFELVIELLGKRVERMMRADYTYTPDWEYFDLRKYAPYVGWASSEMGFSILTVPDEPYEGGKTAEIEADNDEDEDDPDPPTWVKLDFAGEGILPREVWNAIDDLIDEKCKAEDLERGHRHGQVVLNDHDWFFWGVGHSIFRDQIAEEAHDIARKATHIKIPKPDPDNWQLKYQFTYDGKFIDLTITATTADIGTSHAMIGTYLDLSLIRRLQTYDKFESDIIDEISGLLF